MIHLNPVATKPSLYFYEMWYIQETGPTIVGDEDADHGIMKYLGASLGQTAGNTLYVSPSHIILYSRNSLITIFLYNITKYVCYFLH